MPRVPPAPILVLLFVLAVAAGGFGFWLRERMVEEEARDWASQIAGWTHPDGLPDLPLVDQDGQLFSLHDLSRRWVLVGFVFTRCERSEACPMTMQQMATVQSTWTHEDAPLFLLTVTIDPEVDTPGRLLEYGKRFGRDPDRSPPWILATGDRDLMTKGLPSLFNVVALPSEEGFDHTVKLALLAPGLTLERSWDGATFSVAALREATQGAP